jgi:hypothetical protein
MRGLMDSPSTTVVVVGTAATTAVLVVRHFVLIFVRMEARWEKTSGEAEREVGPIVA